MPGPGMTEGATMSQQVTPSVIPVIVPEARTERDVPPGRQGMRSDRKVATLVGVLFIVGDIAGVLSFALMSKIFEGPGVLGNIATNHGRLVAGALLVMVMGFALAMIPVLLYPIFRRYDEAMALACVVFRGAIETVTYLATAIALLTLAELGQGYADGGSIAGAGQQTLATLLTAVRGPITANVTAIVFSIGAAIFYSLFYRSRLIPRWLSVWGLVGAALYLAAPVLELFGSPLGALMAPLAVAELVLAVWLIVRGLDSSPTDTLEIDESRPAMVRSVTQPGVGAGGRDR